ncbi:MAG: hypothetical protein H8E37_11950 [Planctomycetes bacterium]|nr:hypothetical protein [Planctomycetota bacterium]
MLKTALQAALVMAISGVALQLIGADPDGKVSNRPIARDFVRPVFIGFSEKELDILDSLEQKASAEFVDKPLGEIIAALSEKYEIPIDVEELALEDAGVSLDQRTTAKQTGKKLRTVLSEILGPLYLAWAIKDDSVVITTADCNWQNYIAVYPIGDFMVDGGDPADLSDVIQSSTNCMWKDLDGDGGLVRHVRGSKSLVIAQPLYGHYEIVHVLACLRAGRRISNELEQRINGKW